MSTWKQRMEGKYTESSGLSDLIQIKQENIKLKIQVKGLKEETTVKDLQIEKLSKMIMKMEKEEKSNRDKVIEISSSLSLEEINEKDMGSILELISEKIKKNRISNILKRSRRDEQKNDGETSDIVRDLEVAENSAREKSIIIKELEEEVVRLKSLLKAKNEEFDHILNKSIKLTDSIATLEAEKLNLEVDLANYRKNESGHRGEKIREQCVELMNKITVREDDYLIKYLKSNELSLKSSEQVSKRNKYEFIFEN